MSMHFGHVFVQQTTPTNSSYSDGLIAYMGLHVCFISIANYCEEFYFCLKNIYFLLVAKFSSHQFVAIQIRPFKLQ